MEFNVNEVCRILGITKWTLTNWYQWQRIALENGEIDTPVLPKPSKREEIKGKPRYWTDEQVEELKEFKKHIIKGRNGFMGRVTNPVSRQAKRK